MKGVEPSVPVPFQLAGECRCWSWCWKSRTSTTTCSAAVSSTIRNWWPCLTEFPPPVPPSRTTHPHPSSQLLGRTRQPRPSVDLHHLNIQHSDLHHSIYQCNRLSSARACHCYRFLTTKIGKTKTITKKTQPNLFSLFDSI